MTIQEMKKRKKELGYSNETLAALSGVPLGTVNKIFSGATKAPRSATVDALVRVLSAGNPMTDSSMLGETPAVYSVKKEETEKKTLKDYYALPAEARMELVDGKFYDLASPSINHQRILLGLATQFFSCEKKQQGCCTVLIAPCDVQLDQDPYTVVQPDLMVVCDAGKLSGRRCEGAPDLIVEIMSPSTRSHDAIRKLNKYKTAGVKEYWLVDPEERHILVYLFGKDNAFGLYSFSDRVPVGILNGKCVIDFPEIEDMLLPEASSKNV